MSNTTSRIHTTSYTTKRALRILRYLSNSTPRRVLLLQSNEAECRKKSLEGVGGSPLFVKDGES